MPPAPSLQQIKELLADGQTEPAVDLLLELTKATHRDFHDDAIAVKSRLEKLQQKGIKGIISSAEESLEENKITDSVIALIAQIERNERPELFEEIPPPKPAVQQMPTVKKLIWGIPVLIVLAFLLPKFFSKEPSTPSLPGTEQKQLILETTLHMGKVVFSKSQKPVEGAQVRFNDEIEAVTDANGKFQVNLPSAWTSAYVEITLRGEIKQPSTQISLSPQVLGLLKIRD
jgi:hypothetical protein